jgi:zinc transport system permease protein
MAILAAVVGCIAVVLGLLGSAQWDLPTGPAIVMAAAILFLMGFAVPVGIALRRR